MTAAKAKAADIALAEKIIQLAPKQREVFLANLSPSAGGRVRELIAQYQEASGGGASRIKLLPHQQLPEPKDIDKGAVLAGGRGAGKSFAAANYLARICETVSKIRARVIAPTLADAVQSVVLDPDSGVLAQSPSAVFKSSGIEGARVVWPNKSTLYLIGTPTLKDVDRLRALTNIDVDHYEEAAANPRLAEAVKQADLSRRGSRLPHPIWIASTTPRPVPQYKEWLKDPRVVVKRASTLDNPHTPDEYRDYAESLKGTHLYRQEVMGEVVDDVAGALWTQVNIDRSIVSNDLDREKLLSILDRVIVAVDPPSGHGTCGIAVMGITNALEDPTESSRIVILDDFSIEDASPAVWGGRVVDAAKTYGANVIAERNQGGLMVESTIRRAAEDRGDDFLTVTLAHARISKEQRAAPVALLWELDTQRAVIVPPQGQMSRIALLIEQMTSWIPKTFSPDRLDAMVWGATELMRGGGSRAALQPARPKVVTPAMHFRQALMGMRR